MFIMKIISMLRLVKKNLPKPLKRLLQELKYRVYDQRKKKLLLTTVNSTHARLQSNITGSKSIKVVFLVLHKSIWKVDSVFQKMLIDPYFDPVILICPCIQDDDEIELNNLHDTYQFFKKKKYPVVNSYNEVTASWVKLEELEPGLVFFTNPHSLTMPEYFANAYENYLTCYVPYYFMATNHVGRVESEFNTLMLNSMWRTYWPHDLACDQFSLYSFTNGVGASVTGYPACEPLVSLSKNLKKSVWKNQTRQKKKIIYAPHHTIEEDEKSLSFFLSIADQMLAIAKENNESIQWAFKPHPLLKTKLYSHADWGRVRTDHYFSCWASQSYTQLEDSEYEYLFKQSDAIIHDCSSFIVEYALVRKPGLYLIHPSKIDLLVNEFGKSVLKEYQLAQNTEQIQSFLKDLINGKLELQESRDSLFQEYVQKYYTSKLPADRIIENLKISLELV
ncbi:MAG: hypothetical protein ISEC1_P0829 [Thiomicrorhabdus sp.]|nr:MAG: hypothetical protein ISEC1_P0829 [Thiomicrorhabdus sp.]